MIKKLKQSDHEKLMKYVSKEPEMNLLIIGDIENYGYDSNFQTVWGEYDQNNKLKAVFIKFYKFFIIYSDDNDYSKEKIISIIKNYDFDAVSGKLKLIMDLKKYFNDHELDKHFFAKLDSSKNLNLKKPANSKLIKVTEENLKEGEKNQFDLFKKIDEFDDFESSKESFKNEILSGTKRVYQLKYDNRIVSTVSTTAESSNSAMIVGVATHPQFRYRGFATYLISKLSSDLLNENKTLCLFYDNPEAGSIYRRLGFEEIGKWGVLSK